MNIFIDRKFKRQKEEKIDSLIDSKEKRQKYKQIESDINR